MDMGDIVSLTDCALPNKSDKKPKKAKGPRSDGPSIVWSMAQLINRPFGRTYLTAEIKAGKLKATKVGRYQLITDEDWRAYLAAKLAARPQFESWRPLRGISPMPISKTDPLLSESAHRNAGVAISGSFCS